MKDGIIYRGHFCPIWGGVNINKSVKFFSGGIEDISVALLAGNHNAAVVTEETITNNNDMAKIYRIRKLTPLECMRLMGVKDEDTQKMKDAGISDSQLYKMAGNSIVVQVLEGIFTQMFRADKDCLF